MNLFLWLLLIFFPSSSFLLYLLLINQSIKQDKRPSFFIFETTTSCKNGKNIYIYLSLIILRQRGKKKKKFACFIISRWFNQTEKKKKINYIVSYCVKKIWNYYFFLIWKSFDWPSNYVMKVFFFSQNEFKFIFKDFIKRFE